MTSRTSKRKVISSDRRKEAWALRRMGWSLSQIAEKLEVSKQAVHKMIVAQLEENQAAVSELARVERELQAERLDVLWNNLYAEVINAAKAGNAVLNLGIIDRLLKIAERRAKLFGLDAPTKTTESDADEEERKYNPYESLTLEQRRERIREVFAREGIDIPLDEWYSEDASED